MDAAQSGLAGGRARFLRFFGRVERRRTLHSWPFLLGCLLAVTMGVVVCLVIDQARRSEIQIWRLRMLDMTNVLAAHASLVFENTEGVIDSLVRTLDREGIETTASLREIASTEKFHENLAGRTVGDSHINTLSVIDADGNMLANNRVFPLPPRNVASRDYFNACRDRARSDVSHVFVGRAVASIINGDFVIPMCKPLFSSDGVFVGLVAGSISTEFFREFYKTNEAAQTRRTTLLRSDGILLAGNLTFLKLGENVFRGNGGMDAESLKKAMDGDWTYRRGTSPTNAVPRLLVVRALTEFPLYVVTSVDGAEVLRKWRVNAVIFSAVGALFCLVVLALGYWSGWTYMHQKELLYQARRARDATESAERSKLRFVSLISHDLRTPLTALIGGAEMIERGQPLDERRRYLDLIKTSAGQVLAMVDGILNLSASDVRGGRAASTPFVVRDVINANLAIGSVGALAKGINLDSEIAEAVDEPVLGDPAILSQILLNVLSNAIKYTPTGSVTVVADMTRESDVERVAVISVVDTGPVIPSVYRDKLFDPFERGERTSDPNPDGHGLGLSVVRQLLTIVGGEISVDSAIGVGSTFTMRIPYMRAPAASAQSSASQASSAPLKILVADDVMSIQLVVRGMLQKMGHEVTCVANGALALAAARAEKFDLILMDIQMPEMDGLEATRRIRQLPGYRVVPIVAMTGLDRDGDRDAATLKIMDGYLRKPLGYDKLAEAIAETRRDNNAPRAGAAGA